MGAKTMIKVALAKKITVKRTAASLKAVAKAPVSTRETCNHAKSAKNTTGAPNGPKILTTASSTNTSTKSATNGAKPGS